MFFQSDRDDNVYVDPAIPDWDLGLVHTPLHTTSVIGLATSLRVPIYYDVQELSSSCGWLAQPGQIWWGSRGQIVEQKTFLANDTSSKLKNMCQDAAAVLWRAGEAGSREWARTTLQYRKTATTKKWEKNVAWDKPRVERKWRE
ncbi:hypothetical protein EDD85DRAFT_795461 [Armillaria nabsnona]|nr:hypothetical protein EDD85DRAFT_795461 [Armillaria nabsnona]